MIRKLAVVSLCVLMALISGTALAGGRPDKDWKNWFGHISGGWVLAQPDLSDLVDDDWYLSGGATYWPTDWPIGIDIELGYSDYDVKNEVIQAINDAINSDPNNSGGIDGGDVTIWQLNLNGIWGPGGSGTGFYLTAGVGAYYWEGRAKTTGLVYYPPACGGYWWWWCVPGGVGPGTIIAGSESSTDFGWNAGAGFSFEVGGNGSQLYIEAKYNQFSADAGDAAYVPITLGYRW